MKTTITYEGTDEECLNAIHGPSLLVADLKAQLSVAEDEAKTVQIQHDFVIAKLENEHINKKAQIRFEYEITISQLKHDVSALMERVKIEMTQLDKVNAELAALKKEHEELKTNYRELNEAALNENVTLASSVQVKPAMSYPASLLEGEEKLRKFLKNALEATSGSGWQTMLKHKFYMGFSQQECDNLVEWVFGSR